MINRLFTPEQLRVLLRPERWRLIAPWQAPRRPGQGRHQAWYEAHRQIHSHREVLLGLAGRTPYGLGPGLIVVGPGTVAVFDSMVPHQTGYPAFGPDVDHLWLSLLSDVFTARVLRIRRGRIQTQSSATLLCDAAEVGLALTPRALGLEPAPDRPDAVRAMRLMAAVAAMMATLAERGYAPAGEQERAAQQARMIATIQQHLRETAGRGDSVASLARIAGCSPFHFMRLFRRHTGHTVLGFIDLCRCRKAAAWRAQGRSQKEIGYALGFSCPQTFSRWFRRHEAACRPDAS
jgi:AraC-like DNA-binding protein